MAKKFKIIQKDQKLCWFDGNHNPGFANDLILESDLIVALGCSLLQHQVGKVHSNFAPKSKI